MLSHPFLDSSFPPLWSAHLPANVVADISLAVDRAQAAIDAVARQDLGQLTFQSTFLALESSTEPLGNAWSKVGHLQSVADSPALREAHNAVLPKVTSLYAGIPLNSALWERLKTFAGMPAALALTGVHRRLVDETMADFRQAGADLPLEKRQRLEALQSELAQLTQRYSENVLDGTNQWELIVDDDRRLAGLPAHAVAGAKRSAESKKMGTPERPVWRFTLHMPSQEPCMTYLEDEGLRREMWHAAAAIGTASPVDNTELVRRILTLRAEKAALLGQADFADLVLARRMAKTGARALGFLEEFQARAAPAFARECRELEEFKARTTGAPRPSRLAPWAVALWAERLRREKYAFDEEILRPYFPMAGVIAGLFELAHRVFGLQVRECAAGTFETWHTEVRFYEMHDRRGRHVGSFYADWHPRESKRGGAWMGSLITGGPTAGGGRAPHLGYICGNLTPPNGARPALLTHREVETVFHEFGHLIHHLLGEVEIKSLNGTNVAWDFVELPSQIMENWCWERASLDLLARHFETGERIPDEIFEKLIAAKNFRAACATMRQVAFAKMDLLLHRRTAAWTEGEDVEPVARALIADCLVPTEPPLPTIVKRFNHLFSDPVGYAAGYYSYKWAEVLDADAFSRFRNEGLFSAEVGREFVEKILSRGNAADPLELFRDFMGRDPDVSALLKRSGLAVA